MNLAKRSNGHPLKTNNKVSKTIKISVLTGVIYALLTFNFLLLTFHSQAQLGVNTTGAEPDSSAILDASSTSQGLLIPRISLTSTTSASPVTLPATSLLIYNTATVNDVTPGFYYWNGSAWKPLMSSANGWSTTGNSGTTAGTNFIGTTDNQDIIFKHNNIISGWINDTLGNTAFGVYTLNPAITGGNNTAIGTWSLQYNIGWGNTALGQNVLAANGTGNDNTATGDYSMSYNDIGNSNTANGVNSLFFNTSGSNNIALGNNAGYYNTTMSDKIWLGYLNMPLRYGTNNTTTWKTLVRNDSGEVRLMNDSLNAWSLTGNSGKSGTVNFIGTTDDVDVVFKRGNVQAGLLNSALANTSWGVSALKPTSTGYNNTANGSEALSHNTTGNDNTANGAQALFFNTTGSDNTANGISALLHNTTGGYNTANGSNALSSNTTGSSNTATGAQALQSNTTGNGSTATGLNALQSNTGGYNNTATGTNALSSNTTGYQNTANGSNVLSSNSIGGENTANGFIALTSNTTGSDNTANGQMALLSNTTGSNNTASGVNALSTNTTGSNNTALGYGANVASGALTNATAIGANAIVGESNALVLGGTGANAVNVGIGLTTPASALEVNGAIATTIQKVTGGGTTTLDNTTEVWYVTSTAATFTLPNASTCTNRRYILVAVGVAITTSDYTNLSGTTVTTVASNSSVEIISDGTNWLQIK
jgi:hypothetical protein